MEIDTPLVRFLGWYAGVGSRKVPEYIMEYMIRIGRTKTDLGMGLSSGDAYRADRAFWYGAKQSEHYNTIGARLYLAQNGNNGRRIGDMPFLYDATDFTDTYAAAEQLACAARGGWHGIGDWGIAQHTRNAMQIHGHTLKDPVKELIYWGEPKGRRESEKVNGGTNTAVQLAKMAGVPIRLNLYYEDHLRIIEDWLAVFESEEPYEETDWTQIYDPKDPLMLELN